MVCYVNFLSATSPNTMDGSPARSIALIHQLHVAGEEGGSATMVAVFLPVLPVGVVLWLSSRDVTRSSYVAVGTKKTKGGAGAGVRYVTLCPTLACTTPVVAVVDQNTTTQLDFS
jgi:hypothetical protein